MKKLILTLVLLVSGCFETTRGIPSKYPTLVEGNSEIGVQVFLKTTEISGICEINLTMFNRTIKDFNPVLVEISMFGRRNENLGRVNFYEKLLNKETIQRKSLFAGSSCIGIKDIKLTSLKY